MKTLLSPLLATLLLIGAFTTVLAETERTATVEYLAYAKNYVEVNPSGFRRAAAPTTDVIFGTPKIRVWLILVLIKDGERLVIRESDPSKELREFLQDVVNGTIIYITARTDIAGNDVIASMTNLSTGKKYNR